MAPVVSVALFTLAAFGLGDAQQQVEAPVTDFSETIKAAGSRHLTSSVVGCPASNTDCGECKCVPSSSCSSDYCLGKSTASTGSWSSDKLVNCGTCKSVPEATCAYCGPNGGPAEVEGNDAAQPAATVTQKPATVTVKPATSGATPSSVVGCPASNTDCGQCKCVPSSSCSSDYCLGKGTASTGSAGASSSIKLVNCGTCKSVPESTCAYCGPNGGRADIDVISINAASTASVSAVCAAVTALAVFFA